MLEFHFVLQNVNIVEATTERLGIVQLATAEEIEEGAVANKAVTPALLKGAIDSIPSNATKQLRQLDLALNGQFAKTAALRF